MRFIILVTLLTLSAHAQKLAPYQINWTSAFTCASAGCPVQFSPLGAQSVAQPPGTTLSINSLNTDLTVGGNGYTTIQAAVNEAATIGGSVTILTTYSGTDTWTNASNVHIDDKRAYNPTNAANYSAGVTGPMPRTTIKAADYGAVCNGINDDTAAINAALAALTTLIGGAGGSTVYMGPAVVELPQGRCEISYSLVSKDYGGLIGSPNGTWIYPLEPWLGSDGSLVELTTSYVPNATGNHPGGVNRVVSGINFEYNYNATQHTAIKVFSAYGHSSSAPYPSASNDPQVYQLKDVTISNNYIYAMDTGIDLEDCQGCLVADNFITAVRVGIWDNGNDYVVTTRDNNVTIASESFTPAPSTTNGIAANSSTRYYCNSPGTGASCTGGSVTEVVASPQDFGVYASTVDGGWTIAGNFVDALALTIGDGSCFCDSPTALYLGNLVGVNITNSSISTTNGKAIDIQAPSSNPATGEAEDNGWWIDNNIISTDNNSSGTAYGVVLESGSYPLVDLSLQNNQFFGFYTGVQLNGPLTQSRIVGNYGDDNANALIVFNAAGASSFVQTVVHDNTSRDSLPIYIDTAGGGYIIGYNSSPVQTTGQQTATGSGCSITAGAIGNDCVATITLSNAYHAGDSAYNVIGCQLAGASTNATIGVAANLTATTFTVVETALTTSAVTGGNIACQVFHP